MEQNYKKKYIEFQKALRLRNNALKETNKKTFKIWNDLFVEKSIEISSLRNKHLDKIIPLLKVNFDKDFPSEKKVNFRVENLWLEEEDLGNKHSIFLVDDLPSELDEENFLKCLELILDAPGQKFVSSIDPDFLGIKGRFKTLIAL